jgi:hypothetical protein
MENQKKGGLGGQKLPVKSSSGEVRERRGVEGTLPTRGETKLHLLLGRLNDLLVVRDRRDVVTATSVSCHGKCDLGSRLLPVDRCGLNVNTTAIVAQAIQACLPTHEETELQRG